MVAKTSTATAWKIDRSGSGLWNNRSVIVRWFAEHREHHQGAFGGTHVSWDVQGLKMPSET